MSMKNSVLHAGKQCKAKQVKLQRVLNVYSVVFLGRSSDNVTRHGIQVWEYLDHCLHRDGCSQAAKAHVVTIPGGQDLS